jgi:putative FmdB family regulatory protein
VQTEQVQCQIHDFSGFFEKQYDAQILDDCGLGVDLLNFSMPLFEFLCADCEKTSELLVRSSGWRQEKCPSCGSGRLEKQLSAFSPMGSATAETPPPQCTGNPSACGLCP